MSSPWPTLQLTGLYLFIVYAGMRVMKHREAYSLKVVLGVYNLAMVLLNFYIFKEVSAVDRLSAFFVSLLVSRA